MKHILVAAFVILSFTASFAQIDTLQQESVTPPSGKKWTLKECIDYALANNLSIQQSIYNVESSEVDLRQAQFARLPSINGGVGYGYSWGRGLDPVTNSFTSQQIRSSNISGNASLPLYNGLRIHNSVRQAKTSLAATEYDLAKTKNDQILNVANLFITVVFNKELVDNAKFQLASSQQQLDRTRKQVAAGALPKSEELNLDAQLAGNEVTVIQQENALALSLLQLKQALLIPASAGFDIEIPQLDPEDLVIDQTRDEIFNIARGTLPEIKSAELRIQSTSYGVKANRGNFFPRLSLNAGVNTNYSSAQEAVFYPDGGYQFPTAPNGSDRPPFAFVNKDMNMPVYGIEATGAYRNTYLFKDQIQDNIYRTLGFQLSIPILNGFNVRSDVQRSIIQNQQAKIDAQAVSQTLRQNVETAYNEAVAASKTYNASLRQVAAREEAFRMMEQRHQAGAATAFEFQVSQNDLYQAKTELTRAKYDFIFKTKVLDFYQGNPLDY